MNKYDLMITDIGMPEMNGYQLAEIVHRKYPDISIVALSGWGENLSEEERETYGIMEVVQKPIQKKHLEELIHKVMKLKKSGNGNK